MSEKETRRLKIVPFSATDYTLGENLLEPTGTFSEDPTSISNKLALFFQWTNLSTVHLVIPSKEIGILECSLSYDADELEPTEIHLTLTERAKLSDIREIKSAVLRIELFRTCFEFRSEVLAVNDEGDLNSWDLIIEVPSSVITLKQKRLPRVKVSEGDVAKLPIFRLCDAGAETILEIEELGLNSISVKKIPEPKNKLVQVSIGGNLFNTEFVRNTSSNSIFQFKWNDSLDFGAFFEIYRKIAFPDLIPRTRDQFENVFQLYLETDYLTQFNVHENLSDIKSKLLREWEIILESNHIDTADYLTSDKKGKLTGASSVTRAFSTGDQQLWVFHQLCSKRSPSTLQSSGHLYTWRAEYLIGRPDNFKIIGWFRSASRWLERIYVKFTRQSKGSSTLRPIRLLKGQIQSSDDGAVLNESSQLSRIENLNRTIFSENTYFGGLGPDFLNASELLNGIVSWEPNDEVSIKKVSNALLHDQKRSKADFYLTLNIEDRRSFDGFNQMPSDRFFMLSKADLFDFISSVEHSIAITHRKLG